MSERPEIAELLKLKQARRRRLARLSFEDKIEIIERLRELQFNRSLMQKHQQKGNDKDARMKA